MEALCFRARVPIHQPAEPSVERLDLERVRRGKGLCAAGPPESAQRSVGIALEPLAHDGDAGAADMAAETIEALDADQRTEAAASVFEQPEQSKRMADGDGVLRPVVGAFEGAFGAPGNETEIDKADAGAGQALNDTVPETGVEAPTMDEQEMHLPVLL